MKNPMFKAIQIKLLEMGETQEFLSVATGMSPSAISSKMNGKSQWLASEMYSILEAFHEPPEKLHIYFPKNDAEGKVKKIRELLRTGT